LETGFYREIIFGWKLSTIYALSSAALCSEMHFHPEMVFLANPGLNLHICLCGTHQVASAQTIAFLDLGRTGTRPAGVGRSTRSV